MRMICFLAATTAFAFSVPAVAAPVSLTTRILKEQRSSAADGTTTVKLVPARGAVPGDRLVYILAYRNAGAAPVSDLVIANPLAVNVAYRAPAEGSPAPELSVDGARFGSLATLTAMTTQGTPRPASRDDVRALRWRIAGPVPAGAQGEVSFEATLR